MEAEILNEYTFNRISSEQIHHKHEIRCFLSEHGLGIDDDIEYMILACDENDQIIACGGIAANILKSIAISETLQGSGFSLKLMTELTSLAYELGRFSLFLFTKPENVNRFRQSGFYLVEKFDSKLALMENSPSRLIGYCNKLAEQHILGNKIGSIVMNANPFTLGHQHLVEQACQECDWVHLFVVKEEGSDFSFIDRLTMIRAGTKHFSNLTVHSGSEYIISRATFPTYFLKEQQLIDYVHTALDLKIFRHFIAPSLGITHRYVGTEPVCTVTKNYNLSMYEWLENKSDESPAIAVVEIPRIEQDNQPISASRVRKLLKDKNISEIRSLVPETTYSFLCRYYIYPALLVNQGKFRQINSAV